MTTPDARTAAPFEIKGVNHVALVCSNMARTVDFYQDVLGFPLVKTVQLPNDMGQHFFFDMGAGNTLAFFWFSKAPGPAPGVAAPAHRPDTGDLESAVGSMNHLAFTIDNERFDDYRQRLLAKGIDCSIVINHDDSELTVCEEMHPGVYIRSMYFQDPDGILLEFAAWTKALEAGDVRHAPQGADLLAQGAG
jgi:catechol 2,3-dioxygenase-like lactoylglutathione lyase family enzyme